VTIFCAAWRGSLSARPPNAEIQFFDTSHFALETHAKEIGAAICTFLAKIRK